MQTKREQKIEKKCEGKEKSNSIRGPAKAKRL